MELILKKYGQCEFKDCLFGFIPGRGTKYGNICYSRNVTSCCFKQISPLCACSLGAEGASPFCLICLISSIKNDRTYLKYD